MRAILTLKSIPITKPIALDGPVAFRIRKRDQCVDHSPDNISKANIGGELNN